MIDSVLNSIKKPLGLAEDYDAFDEDIVMHINSVFSTLHSIGASPATPFMIDGPDEKWSDFLANVQQAQMVKSYMYIKVRLLFDPPATSFTIDSMKRMADEWEWRLNLLEFEFTPESAPVYNSDIILDLADRVEKVEDQVEEVDEEVDRVPNLSVLFNENLGGK